MTNTPVSVTLIERDTAWGLTDALVAVAIRKATAHARRIARMLGLGVDDAEDLRQELLLQVLRRAHLFDPVRGSWQTFVEMVLRQGSLQLTADLISEYERYAGSLDAPVQTEDEGTITFADAIMARDDVAIGGATGEDLLSEAEWRVDLERFVSRLPEPLDRLCSLLLSEERTDALRLSGLSTADAYRQLHDLRMRMRVNGLDPGTP